MSSKPPPPSSRPGADAAPGSSRPTSSRPPPSPRTRAALVSHAELDFSLITPASRIIGDLLGIAREDRVLIVHDAEHRPVARAFAYAAGEAGASVERLDLAASTPRPWRTCPEPLLDAIKSASATMLIASMEDDEMEMRRAFVAAATSARAKHVHMIGASLRAFIASASTSTQRIFDLMEKLQRAMRPSTHIAVRSPSGTDLDIQMAPHLRWFSHGERVRAGQWMNVPFGALISSPAAVSGTYVVDSAISGAIGVRLGLLRARPLRLTIKNSHVTAVDCLDAELRRHVQRFIDSGQNHGRVGLVSLGANLGMISPLGEFCHDEHMPGAHLSLGETFARQTGATWSGHEQLAFAMADADVDLDGEALIRRGRYVQFV